MNLSASVKPSAYDGVSLPQPAIKPVVIANTSNADAALRHTANTRFFSSPVTILLIITFCFLSFLFLFGSAVIKIIIVIFAAPIRQHPRHLNGAREQGRARNGAEREPFNPVFVQVINHPLTSVSRVK
jgi:hypothetical protein